MSGLHLRAISHAFGSNKVLHNVSVSVAPGELVCLLGPSGCGKTTLLRLAAGLEGLQTGQVEIDGVLVADADKGVNLPPEKRGVGLMFQDYALFPHLTIRENISFGVSQKGNPDQQKMLSDGMLMMGISSYADAYPHTLSGGQQQRVALLRALAPGPNVLLLDEPFSGLDVTRRAQVRKETLRTIKNTGVGTLMVTHDPEEAMFMADRILVMNEGEVVQDGSPTDLYFHPHDQFVTELFGPVNEFAGTVENNLIKTSIGDFPVTGYGDGTELSLLIRPEGFLIDESHGDLSMKVITARPLGRSSVVMMELDNGTPVEARVPGVVLPEAGSTVAVTIRPEQIHYFPKSPTR